MDIFLQQYIVLYDNKKKLLPYKGLFGALYRDMLLKNKKEN